MTLVELVVAMVVFVVVMAMAGPLIVRVGLAQTTLRQRDASVTGANDAFEQVVTLACAATLRTSGTAAERTTLVNRAASCAGLAGAGATVTPFGTVSQSTGDVLARARANTLEISSTWLNPALGRTSWLPAGVARTDSLAIIAANAPRTPTLLLQRVVARTSVVAGQNRTRTVTNLSPRSDTEVPAGPVGRLDVFVPAAYEKVAILFRTVGTGGPAIETMWLVRTTLNLDDNGSSASLLTGSGWRVASFPYISGGAGVTYSVKGIDTTGAGAETAVRTCSATNVGDPSTGADLNVCTVS